MKNLYIKTFGCQMNEYDSKRIASLLAPLGFVVSDDVGAADLIILNTCSIREKAEEKVHSMLGRLKKIKKAKSGLIIALGGCVAQQVGKRLLSRNRHLDLVFGTKRIQALPGMIDRIIATGDRLIDTGEAPEEDKSFESTPSYYQAEPKAFVTVIEGCDNFCSYCIVPYVRGREKSRPAADILREIRTLAENGVREITLLGQNVNSYRDLSGGDVNFPALLRQVASIDGIERLRFVTSHPKDLTDELIDCYGTIERLCSHIHLPAQSGSDKILGMMNRKYTKEEYLSKVDKLKKVCHNISVSTDIIVGFPGETRDDFQKTIDLVNEVDYDSSFSFKYSKRPGTKAAEFIDDLNDGEKSERLCELQELQKSITLRKNRYLEGQVKEILVEGSSKKDTEKLTGRTTCNRVVNFKGGSDLKGKIVKVKIKKGFVNSLKGELL